MVIDEHGDRKWGKKTAHVGRPWLANIGKTESGVVSVTSLLADERIYYPVAFEPYTPSRHFEGGNNYPHFSTKLKIASQLVELAISFCWWANAHLPIDEHSETEKDPRTPKEGREKRELLQSLGHRL